MAKLTILTKWSKKSKWSCKFLILEMILEILIDEMDGEAHDVEIRTVHSGASDVTDPFLHSVGTGFVEGTVMGDVMVDFSVGEFGESYVGAID